MGRTAYSSGLPGLGERLEQRTDLVADLCGMPHRVPAVDDVSVSTSNPLAFHVTGFDQVGQDALRRTFRDADTVGHVPQPDVRRLGDAQEDLGMVGEERPGLRV